jgi:hypothetical protein
MLVCIFHQMLHVFLCRILLKCTAKHSKLGVDLYFYVYIDVPL